MFPYRTNSGNLLVRMFFFSCLVLIIISSKAFERLVLSDILKLTHNLQLCFLLKLHASWQALDLMTGPCFSFISVLLPGLTGPRGSVCKCCLRHGS